MSAPETVQNMPYPETEESNMSTSEIVNKPKNF